MLKKLIKYDARAIMRHISAMYVASGALSIICCALFYFTLSISESDNMAEAFGVVTGFYVLGVFAIAAMFFVSLFGIVARYYKSLFTDEGYLTMVIPVKVGTLLTSKVISTAIFFFASFAVFFFSIFVALALPTMLYDSKYLVDFLERIAYVFSVDTLSYTALTVVGVIEAIVLSLENIMIILCSVTLGAVVMRKRKILGAVLFFFIINLGYSALGGIFDLTVYFSGVRPSLTVDILLSLLRAVLAIGVFLLMYLVNYRVFKYKFNID